MWSNNVVLNNYFRTPYKWYYHKQSLTKKYLLSEKQWFSRLQPIMDSIYFISNEWHIALSHLSMPKARLINYDPETAEWIFISAILSKSVTYIICIVADYLSCPCNKNVAENILSF